MEIREAEIRSKIVDRKKENIQTMQRTTPTTFLWGEFEEKKTRKKDQQEDSLGSHEKNDPPFPMASISLSKNGKRKDCSLLNPRGVSAWGGSRGGRRAMRWPLKGKGKKEKIASEGDVRDVFCMGWKEVQKG